MTTNVYENSCIKIIHTHLPGYIRKKYPSEPSCSKPVYAKPGLAKKFNCYLFTVKGGFLTTLRFKDTKFVIYNLLGPQFCG